MKCYVMKQKGSSLVCMDMRVEVSGPRMQPSFSCWCCVGTAFTCRMDEGYMWWLDIIVNDGRCLGSSVKLRMRYWCVTRQMEFIT